MLRADEQRIGVRGTTRRMWGRGGVKVRQRLHLHSGWCALFAAVDARSGTLWWDWVGSMKAADRQPVLAEVRARSLLDALVWDGAPARVRSLRGWDSITAAHDALPTPAEKAA